MTQIARQLFLAPEGILVPNDFSCYGALATAPCAHQLLKDLDRPLEAPYIMSLTDDVALLTEPELLWASTCDTPAARLQGGISWQSPAPATTSARAGGQQGAELHGVLGFFTSSLAEGLAIDTRPGRRTCMHWEVSAPFEIIPPVYSSC